MPTTRHLLLLGVALIAAASLTACGGLGGTASEPSDAPSSPAQSSSAEQPTPSAPAPVVSAAKDLVGTPRPDGNRWAVKLASDGANTDPKTWPDASKVFSTAEITSVIPSTTNVKVVECEKGTWIFGPDRGKRTPHNVACSYEITSDLQAYIEPLRLYVSFAGFLSRDEARAHFEEGKALQRKQSKKYPDQWMDLGRDSYWTGANSQVFVSNGTVGGTFQLSWSGSLIGIDDYEAAKRWYRDELEVPFAEIIQSKL